ncbi:ATP-binding protein [Methylobacterium sp. E-066]|uniref:ATP-binding protein n=1 Tax=Methylobacterium sp. E-066 TaxID=2836584 RepID=UPI001FBC0069|nr:ATP-binding protein [Methylobacterium sp. E-066]MCJ2143688.1 ATP-binding protein [Methylobacterium sp. E-066]
MAIAKAKANPTKAFFVHMITRDINLSDCILDLIDNSIDAARTKSAFTAPSLDATPDYKPYSIEISISKDEFQIKDNCGGLSLSDATDYAFTFGRRDDDEADPFTIGVYGIGMKRAMFKLGKRILIRSTHEGDPSFKAVIDVDTWATRESKDWDFDLEADETMPSPGLSIFVKDLYSGISDEFGNPAFLNELAMTIKRDYSRFINFGLSVKLNGDVLTASNLQFLEGEGISPVRETLDIDGVTVEILAGMAAKPTEGNEPSDQDPYENRYGWYVLCNDRVVVAADKSEETGWGVNGVPRWHPQYAGFLGILFFSSNNAVNLPLTTTKRRVDQSSKIYRQALVEAKPMTRKWIEYTNARKISIDEARRLENAATASYAFRSNIGKNFTLPTLPEGRVIKERNIAYRMEESRIKKLAEAFGYAGMTAKDVGIQSFEFAEKEMVS